MNIALIKAGGRGVRMGADIPKQFICVDGKPIIIYTLEAFENSPSIDAIIVTCVEGWESVLISYAKKYNITKLVSVVRGGETSLKSIQVGINEARARFSPEDIVLIHDGNRPLVSEEIISDVIVKCSLKDSAVAAIVCTDEVMVTDKISLSSTKFLDRKSLYRIQTPDAYRLGDIAEVIDSAGDEKLLNLGATSTLWIESGHTVNFAQGSELNIRLTTQEDISLFSALLSLKNSRE